MDGTIVIYILHSIYFVTVSSYHMFSALLNWFMVHLGRATGTVHLISIQTSIKCAKAEEWLRYYSLIYILWLFTLLHCP